jgi:hypothetical protein
VLLFCYFVLYCLFFACLFVCLFCLFCFACFLIILFLGVFLLGDRVMNLLNNGPIAFGLEGETKHKKEKLKRRDEMR